MLVTAPVCRRTILAARRSVVYSAGPESSTSQSTQSPSAVAVTAFVEPGKNADLVSTPIDCLKSWLESGGE